MTAVVSTPGECCPRCGVATAARIDGLCAACLLRLADRGEDDAGWDEDELAGAHATGIDEVHVGQRIGNYELVDVIARGGMGIVYRAVQRGAARTVALKVMLPQLARLHGMHDRFATEIEAAARLDHPRILPIYEVGEHAGLPYFSMKYAVGGSLDGRLGELRGDWSRIAALVATLARAVDHAHERGILHRDLKPANILFDGDARPMVADFGLAKLRGADRGATLPAAALGSPSYMAPEQVSALAGEIGPATDVYGLGAILYELLTGRPPLVADDALETLRIVGSVAPAAARSIDADVPAALDAIALRCLAKRPGERYPTAAALADDLERWRATGRAPAPQRTPPATGLRGWWPVLALALAGAVVIGAVTLLPRSDAPRSASHPPPPVAQPRVLGVLPFRNVSGAGGDEYVGEMVTADLIGELRRSPALDLVPVPLVAEAAHGADEEMMDRMRLDLRLDGEFKRRGPALHVHARLADARSGRTVWQQDFASASGDVRALRGQLASSLAAALRPDGRGGDARALVAPAGLTSDAEAYAMYLRARQLLRWRRPETLGEAARLLHAAIERDPRFARAYSALAVTYVLWAPPAPAEADHWTLAVRYAREAMRLDPTLGEPHAVVGNFHFDRAQPNEAEPYFRRALELDPRDPTTLHLYALHLYSVGRLREALRYEQRSVALDGSNAQSVMWLAKMTSTTGDPAEAARLWQRADAMGASRPLCSAVARLQLGQYAPLEEWYRETFARTGVPAALRDPAPLVAGVREPAQRPRALAWLKQVEPYVDPAFAITHYALLDDADDAYRIAAGYSLGDDFWYLYQIANVWAPRTAPLRRHPQFGTLLEKWGFGRYWRTYGPPDLCTVTAERIVCR